LPFINEDRLMNAINKAYNNLTEAEKFRNRRGSDILSFSKKHKLYDELCSLYTKKKPNEVSYMVIIIGD